MCEIFQIQIHKIFKEIYLIISMINKNCEELPCTLWRGNGFFNFRGCFSYGGQRYARFQVQIKEPESCFLTLDIPEREIKNLSLPDISKKSIFDKQRGNYNFPESSRGYEIMTKGKRARLLKVSLDRKIVYDSMQGTF